ncbi:MAG: hypothetical protein AABX97_06850 [Candidatus Thermoplasmatota archaeon]
MLVFLVGGLASPFLIRPSAAYGEHVYEANPILGPGDPSFSVYADQTVAQSFIATATYSLLNVTLRLQNVGSSTNTILVSLHPDDPVNHTPSSVSLASARVGTLNNAPPANISIAFSPAAVVNAGEVYWIVASNGASQAVNGYLWSQSNADTYPGGHADIYNVTSGGWASLMTDMYFVTYGRNYAANLTAAMTADRTQAMPQDPVIFTVYFNNSGTQIAPQVWINDSLPSGFAYVSDTSTLGVLKSSTPFPRFTFSNVSNGVHSFVVTARVTIGVDPGSLLTNRVTLTYTNVSGGLHAGLTTSASVLVGIASKQLYLAPNAVLPRILTTDRPTGTSTSTVTIDQSNFEDFALSPALAGSFRVTNVTASLWVDSLSGNVETLVLDLSVMDRNGTVAYYRPTAVVTDNTAGFQMFTFTFPAGNYTFPASQEIQLRVLNDPSSTDKLKLAFNATSVPSRLDLLTTTYVNVTQVLLQDQVGPASVWSPFDSLIILANVSDPFGAAKIVGAWFNVTTPTSAVVASYVTTAAQTDPQPLPQWKVYRYTFNQSLANGTYSILVTAFEDNGVQDSANGTALVRAPALSFTKVASVVRAKAGDRYAYDLWFNNTGTGPAGRVWINDSLPSQLSFQSSSSTPPGTYTGAYNWTWTSVAPGSNELVINVAVSGSANQVAWIRNQATLSFTDEKGHLWPSLSAYADVVINGPIVNLTLSSSPAARVHANQTVVYTVNLTNGGDAAQTLWLNDTMPSGFTFVGSTASTYGGTANVAGDEILFQFSDMPAGAAWSFTFTLRAGLALSLASLYTDTLGLNYSSLNSVLMPSKVGAVSLLFAAPAIPNGTIDLLPSQASPGEDIPATLTFANVGNEPAKYLWANLTVDAYLTFRNASLPSAWLYTSLRFFLTNVSLGSHTIYLNLTLSGSTPDRYVAAITGTIEYSDEIQNALPVITLTPDQVTVALPSMALSITPGNTTVEAGTPLTYSVYLFNAGSGVAADVWLNMTLPSAFDFYGDTSNASRTTSGANYSWHWANQGSGPRNFAVYLAVRSTVLDGTLTNVAYRLDYQDVNHVARPRVTTIAMVKVIAPAIVLSLQADRSEVLSGNTLTYSLEIRNAGETTARWVSVSDDVDPRLEILTKTSSVPATGNRSLSWNLTDLVPGQSEWINVTVRVVDGTPVRTLIANVFEARYSNSLGGASLGYARSAPVTITIIADILPLIWIGLAGAIAAPALGLLVARRQRVAIEEVFLVYRDGVLLSHLSRTLMADKDEDVLSGMLTAVQEFVRDAFRYGEHRELHQMDFGDYRILIERGKLAYLAVVYSGKNSSSVRKRVRMVLDRIESTYASVLDNWDGDMEKVVGARDIIRDYLLKSNGHSRAHTNGE